MTYQGTGQPMGNGAYAAMPAMPRTALSVERRWLFMGANRRTRCDPPATTRPTPSVSW
jgi:hypothetical protein